MSTKIEHCRIQCPYCNTPTVIYIDTNKTKEIVCGDNEHGCCEKDFVVKIKHEIKLETGKIDF